MHNGKEYADKSLKEALLAFSQGKKVLVLTEYDDGSMNIDNMEKYFTENTTFFVEVPAIENPEFAKALADMVETGKRQRPVPELKDLPEDEPEEDLDEEPEKKSVDVEEHTDPGKACPPPQKPEDRMEEKEVDLPADNIDEKKEKIRKLVEEGYTNREIADQTGIPFGTVGYHAARFRKKEKEPTVDNSDRHLCKSCKFRSNRPEVNNCDYVAITKHSRGCKVEECTKYEKGNRVRAKDMEE